MRRRPWIKLVLLPVVLLSFSCARLDESGVSLQAGRLPFEMLEDQKSVPTEWGKLVAVSESPSVRWRRHWYLGEDGTVRIVFLEQPTARLEPRARVIQRR